MWPSRFEEPEHMYYKQLVCGHHNCLAALACGSARLNLIGLGQFLLPCRTGEGIFSIPLEV